MRPLLNRMNQLSKKKVTFVLLTLALLLSMVSFAPLSVPFSARTKVLIKPAKAWELLRNQQGNLATSVRNHLTGAMESYSISEFSRGDAVQFQLLPQLQNGSRVQAGDTLGRLYSNEEQSKMVALQAEIDVLQAELTFFNTGQKPEDVETARNELHLAEQELRNQRLLTERSAVLLRDSVIAQQEYDLAHNALRVREIALQLAEARLASISTGDKPEQIALSKARIQALQRQLLQVRERISYFTLLAPFDGTVVMRQGFATSDTLLEIHSLNEFIGLAPVLLSDRRFLKLGDRVEITQAGIHQGITGQIVAFDAVSQLVNGQSVVFCTIAFDPTDEPPLPGELLEIKLRGDDIPASTFLTKAFTTP
jgi:multidrug efflux pump subunit AcrA (membrane-fusion protein)